MSATGRKPYPKVKRLIGISDLARFWINVDGSGGVDTCWTWLGAVDKDGYGKFQETNPDGTQRHVRAHRFAFERERGAIPEGLLIIHACDNPRCCNPYHLSAGTQKMNREDCARKGRTAKGKRNGRYTHSESVLRGENHPMATLTNATVREIRRLQSTGLGPTRIARSLALDRNAVQRVTSRRSWGWMP